MVLGVDVGGTFTDAALLDGDRLTTAKSPSTPSDQSEGVVAAVESVLERAGARAGDVERLVHGMTVGTNALLEGKVARTALFATEGFTDLEELGRQARAELYRLCAAHPPPLVPPELRVPVPERNGPEGVLRELDEAELESKLDRLPEDVESAAVCLLWGFRHPEHERRVAEHLSGHDRNVHVSTSHETVGAFREYAVGAGGGSIAWRDAGGALRVGPRSAGADPGPACYRRGGEEPTVTDANLLLGYLDAASPLAGGVELDAGAAERAVGELGRELGLSLQEAAAGIVRVGSTEMARAVRVMTVERGVDPRRLALLAFGGAGPLPAAAIAEELDMRLVLVPPSSGVLSAVGLIAAEPRRDLVESVLLTGDRLSRDAAAEVVGRLAERGAKELGRSEQDVRATYDLRYAGQA